MQRTYGVNVRNLKDFLALQVHLHQGAMSYYEQVDATKETEEPQLWLVHPKMEKEHDALSALCEAGLQVTHVIDGDQDIESVGGIHWQGYEHYYETLLAMNPDMPSTRLVRCMIREEVVLYRIEYLKDGAYTHRVANNLIYALVLYDAVGSYGDYLITYKAPNPYGKIKTYSNIVTHAPNKAAVKRMAETILNGPDSSILEIRPRHADDSATRIPYRDLV